MMAETGTDEAKGALLSGTLAAAVPLWINRIKREQPDWDTIRERAQQCSQTIAEKGDVLMFRSQGTADAFNALAEGLAYLAFQPGGVKFLGNHWEAQL